MRNARRAGLHGLGPRLHAMCIGAGLLAGGGAGYASTPEAWSAFDEEVLRACVAASSLKGAQAAGTRIDFDDQAGVSALLLSGHYAQPRMHNKPGAELCLFDRRSRKAVVTEADQFIRGKPTEAPAATSP